MRKCQPFFSEKEIPVGGWGAIKFAKPTSPRKGVTLDLAKVVVYMRKHGWYQRSPTVTSYDHDLPFDGQVSRIRSLIQGIKDGAELPPVQLFVAEVGGGICFPDGRHRITLLHAAGYETIQAEVPTSDWAEIESELGYEKPQQTHLPRC